MTGTERAALGPTVVVAGGPVTGKSTFLASLAGGAATPDGGRADLPVPAGVPVEVGHLKLGPGAGLTLVTAPPDERYRQTLEELAPGSVGAVVLVDTRRLAESFPVVDHFESSGRPFVVAPNRFFGVAQHSEDDVREALALPGSVPILSCDARHRSSAMAVLLGLVRLSATAAV